MLEEAGMLREEILARLKKLTRKTEEELAQLMKEAGNTALESDDEIYVQAELEPSPISASDILQEILQTGYKETRGEFFNLTKTTARTATLQFENALDRAYMQIAMGGMDIDTTIRRTIKDLSASGVSAVRYPSGRVDSIEVAVRRATITGINQTALKLQEARADEMGCDLVETSAHSGARPEHAKWQGGIYSRSGKSKKYPGLVEVTGYGTALGLGGINCSHSFRPWFEGMSRTYSKELLEEYEARNFEYNGKKLTEYEALQEQRHLERQIRRWKREQNALQAAGLDTSEATAKVREWNGKHKDFLEQTGLKADGTRTVVGKGGALSEERRKMLELKQREAYNKKQEALKKEEERSKKAKEIRALIRSDEVSKTIHAGAQNKHIPTSKGYIEGRSFILGGLDEAQKLVDQYAGTGEVVLTRKDEWANKEVIVADNEVGMAVDPETKNATSTKKFVIHYSKRGTHIVPAKEE